MIVKTASGKQTIKMSKAEWKNIGKKAGWDEIDVDDPIWNKGTNTRDPLLKSLGENEQLVSELRRNPEILFGLMLKHKEITEQIVRALKPYSDKLSSRFPSLVRILEDRSPKLMDALDQRQKRQKRQERQEDEVADWEKTQLEWPPHPAQE